MPECDAHYLAGYLFRIGPTLAAGMGEGPVTHSEIESWQRNTGIELNSWEAEMIRSLSLEYLGSSQKATARDCQAPWKEAPYARPTANLVAERMRQATRELAQL